MKTPQIIAEALLKQVLATPRQGLRRLVAIAGPPASGKSTISNELAQRLTDGGCHTQVVPMDGFHLDNTVLSDLGLLDRKGAPHTFDASGFLRLVEALANDAHVYYPIFDRSQDIAIAGAGAVDTKCDTIIVEGNYLLFDAPIWRDLASHWDYSVWLDINTQELENRLVQRWLDYGLSQSKSKARVESNDLKNIQAVNNARLSADIVIDPNR